jgi:hypothetical protein
VFNEKEIQNFKKAFVNKVELWKIFFREEIFKRKGKNKIEKTYA